MGRYYPYCVAKLVVSFDDFGAQPVPTATGGTMLEYEPTVIPLYPRSATVHYNGYHQADTFDLECDAFKLPITPEALRTVAVQIYLWQADHQLTPAEIAAATDDERHLAIVGLADDASVSFSADGRVFRCQGKDYTALMTAKAWPAAKTIPIGRDLRDVVQELVDEVTHKQIHGGRTLAVEYFQHKAVTTSHTGKEVTQKKIVTKAVTTGQHHKKSVKKGFPMPTGLNYWDVIYKLCLAHSVIVYVEGLKVKIAAPHNLVEAAATDVPRMAYGKNLTSLNIQRRLLKTAIPQITASRYSARLGRTIKGAWPRDADLKVSESATKKATAHAALRISGANTLTREVQVVIPPESIDTDEGLETWCRAYYETKARGEATVSFETTELKDLKKENPSDLLTLRAGQAVRIEYDSDLITALENETESRKRERMIRAGYAPEVADVIARNFDKVKRYRVALYVQNAAFHWSMDTGVSIQCDAVNFIQPTRDSGGH